MTKPLACLICTICLLGITFTILMGVESERPRILAFICLFAGGYMFRCSLEDDPK